MKPRIKIKHLRYTSNWGFCPLASAVPSIAYRLGCEDAKDIETFSNLCERNPLRCPKYQEQIER